MSALWRLVPPSIKAAIYIGFFAFIMGSYVFVFYKGASWKADSIEAKTIIKTVTIREKQNEIRDNRPSVQRTISRMLNNSF